MPKTKTDNIRVLLVGPVPPPYGGIPTYVRELYESGIDGIEFSLFNTALPQWVAPLDREGKPGFQAIFENGVLGAFKMVFYVMCSYFRLLIVIFRKRPHIVQVFTCSFWGYFRNWFYILISRLTRRKTIFHLLNAIDYFYEQSNPFTRTLINLSFYSADMYLVQSPKLEEWVKKHTRKKTKGLWNGLFLEKIPTKGESPILFLPDEFTVGLTVGGLGWNKGTYDILTALERLKSKGVSVGWIFLGGGDVKHFRKITREMGLESRVLFTGPVDENVKWQYLYHADLYCLPSYAEGQPISILEAMAAGLPILSTSVGSIPEVVLDHYSGRIISPGDVDALEEVIVELVENEARRLIMGKEAKRACEKTHDIHRLFDSLKKIYSDVYAT